MKKSVVALVTALAALIGALFVTRGMWKQPPTMEVDAAKITPQDTGKEQEPAQDRVTTEGERHEVDVREVPLASDDPASAGVKRRFLWTVATSEQGWMPTGDLSDASTSHVIRLEGGTAYNIRALTRPHSSVEFALFRAGMTGEPKGFTVDPDALVAEVGIDLYPRRDALLLMRWQQPGAVPQQRLTFQVDLCEETPDERQRGRAITDVGH